MFKKGIQKKLSVMTGLILGSIVSVNSFATQATPEIKSVGNNDTVNVVMSETNLNRVVIRGDKITQIVCPEDFCDAMHTKGDKSGSFLVKVSSPIPFTAFVATQSGRHFAMQVTPQQMNGQTVVINPTGGSTKLRGWEKTSSYRAIIARVMKAMLNGQTPKGFGYEAVKSVRPHPALHGLITMQLNAVWVGNKIAGAEYTVVNKTKKPLTLPGSAYYHRGVRAVAQMDQTIPAKGSSTVYEIISSQ